MHRLLERQLRKHLVSGCKQAELEPLLSAVSEAYEAADADRALLERSIELASRELYERNQELEADMRERKRLESELQQGEKLRAVGQLASGIAHEINTPVQFVGDSVHFLRQSFQELLRLVDGYTALRAAVEEERETRSGLAAAREVEADIDLALLREDIGMAFERAHEGVVRVTEIVRAMKEFAHSDQRGTTQFDLNRGILNTLTVARNEVKYVADVELYLGELPPVPCNPGELNQVLLNLIVNAAHAIQDQLGPGRERGKMTIRSAQDGDHVLVSISDDGGGIPAGIAERIFEPFFTTKEVGRGSGQGLPIARSIVVNKHHGSLTFTTQLGVGTTFHVRLPLKCEQPSSEPKPVRDHASAGSASPSAPPA